MRQEQSTTVLATERIDPVLLDVLAGRRVSALPARAVDQALYSGIEGLFYEVLETTEVDIDHEQRQLLAMAQIETLHAQGQLEKLSRDVFEVLTRHQVPPVIMKGAANGHSLYARPEYRSAVDIDVILGLHDAPGLYDALAELRFPPEKIEAIRTLNERGREPGGFSAPSALGPMVLDFHLNPFGVLLPLRDRVGIVDALVSIDLGGQQVLIPGAELGLALALVHYARDGGVNLKPAGDAVRFLQGAAGPVDWDVFNRLVSTEGLGSVTGELLWALVDDLALDVRPDVARPAVGTTDRTLRVREWSRAAHTFDPQFFTFRVDGRNLEKYGGLLRWYAPSPKMLALIEEDHHGGYVSTLLRRQLRRGGNLVRETLGGARAS